MLNNNSLDLLHNKKNLLAFSAGGDSTALFFLLLEHNIPFDIAIVDYGVREQSKAEVAYAQKLAQQYNLQIYLHTAEKIDKNFEATARAIRYDFFKEIIDEYHYDNLLTAHHLGDRFEWMLMQFCKGAGCLELSGMQELQKRDNYNLIRPLLAYDKTELLEYLHKNNIEYFEDETNSDESIQRNAFRHQHAMPLLEKYKEGIAKSFAYLDEDAKELVHEIIPTVVNDFAYFSAHSTRSNIHTIDKYLKQKGYMISADEKALLKENLTSVLGRKFLVSQSEAYIFISPYVQGGKSMEKTFKEECRLLKIEPKLRPYLYMNPHIFTQVKNLLSKF